MYTEEIKKIIAEVLERIPVLYENIIVADDNAIKGRHCFFIQTKEVTALIGNQGENLYALNHIVKQIIRKKYPEDESAANILIDTNQYYSKKINEILYQAKITAERVKMFRRDIELSPMTAYERLLVHAYFTDDVSIKTESQGEGKFRKVVLKYTDTTKPETIH